MKEVKRGERELEDDDDASLSQFCVLSNWLEKTREHGQLRGFLDLGQ